MTDWGPIGSSARGLAHETAVASGWLRPAQLAPVMVARAERPPAVPVSATASSYSAVPAARAAGVVESSDAHCDGRHSRHNDEEQAAATRSSYRASHADRGQRAGGRRDLPHQRTLSTATSTTIYTTTTPNTTTPTSFSSTTPAARENLNAPGGTGISQSAHSAVALAPTCPSALTSYQSVSLAGSVLHQQPSMTHGFALGRGKVQVQA